jgi:hypothetical protein
VVDVGEVVEGWAACLELVANLVVSYLHSANPSFGSKLEPWQIWRRRTLRRQTLRRQKLRRKPWLRLPLICEV